MHRKISVIIPVYNHALVLWRSLETLAKQTIKPLEVIIVNDGSTDGFETLTKQLVQAPLNIKVINQENQGAPAARNRGLEEASGEYIIFWDADTIASPYMLEKMLNTLESHPEASYTYSQFRMGWKKMRGHEFDPELLKRMNYIDGTSLVRRADLPRGGWDEKLKRFQDWDLWLTMLQNGKTGVFIPEILFRKITWQRKGYSSWFPSFALSLPWKIRSVEEYDKAKEVIVKKHGLKA